MVERMLCMYEVLGSMPSTSRGTSLFPIPSHQPNLLSCLLLLFFSSALTESKHDWRNIRRKKGGIKTYSTTPNAANITSFVTQSIILQKEVRKRKRGGEKGRELGGVRKRRGRGRERGTQFH